MHIGIERSADWIKRFLTIQWFGHNFELNGESGITKPPSIPKTEDRILGVWKKYKSSEHTEAQNKFRWVVERLSLMVTLNSLAEMILNGLFL